MVANERLICAADALPEKGRGARFDLPEYGERATGFVIRHAGKVYGYVNRCAHLQVELDWQEGEFFDATGDYLICATHGACYHPATGLCAAGPCKGRALQALKIEERDGGVYLLPGE
ncbi:MAG: Rieske 2Fe-2S domain-containing protein [Methylobacillus sp.]|jgi:nitrite reductase/ring-hydroxylating ferredoxin subunit|nr:Rieske 2Fe-2S domain-containing protein [Methylobacillus sp.]